MILVCKIISFPALTLAKLRYLLHTFRVSGIFDIDSFFFSCMINGSWWTAILSKVEDNDIKLITRKARNTNPQTRSGHVSSATNNKHLLRRVVFRAQD